MNSLFDDSAIKDLLTKSTDLVKSLKCESKCEPLLDLAKELEKETDDYVSKIKSHHSLNDQMKKMKSRMDVNKELIRMAVNNVSKIRSKLNSRSPKMKPLDYENLKNVDKDNIDDKLKEVNRKVKAVMKDLHSKTKGSTRLERMLEEYEKIMKETGALLRSAPAILKGGEAPAEIKGMLQESVDIAEDTRAEDLLRKMSRVRIAEDEPSKPNHHADEGHSRYFGVGNWINYEGFDTSDELQRFKGLYSRVTGIDSDDILQECEDDCLSETEKEDMEFLEKIFQDFIQVHGSSEDNSL